VAAVLVHIDLDGDRPHPSSLVALAAGRHVASSWGATLYAAVIVSGDDGHAADSTARIVAASQVPGMEDVHARLSRGGADKIVVAMTDTPVAPLWGVVGETWQDVLDHLRPRLVLFGADAPSAAELGPRTGARIGARLLTRARSLGLDDVELRDRDGGYVRASDSGAAVVLVGHAPPAGDGDTDIDLVLLAAAGAPDVRIELVGAAPAEVAHATGTLVVIGDDVLGNPAITADAARLARQLGGHLVGSANAVRAGIVGAGGVVERHTALSPDLCIQIGTSHVDLSGATSIIRIGVNAGKGVDGAMPGPVDENLAALVKRLDQPPPRVRAASEPAAGGVRRRPTEEPR
jgi:electron transfer flavoprotein alpha subunit